MARKKIKNEYTLSLLAIAIGIGIGAWFYFRKKLVHVADMRFRMLNFKFNGKIWEAIKKNKLQGVLKLEIYNPTPTHISISKILGTLTVNSTIDLGQAELNKSIIIAASGTSNIDIDFTIIASESLSVLTKLIDKPVIVKYRGYVYTSAGTFPFETDYKVNSLLGK